MNARYLVTPPTSDEITRAALTALAPGEAGWLVGGCLRDELLGRRVRDVDIAVDGRPGAAGAGARPTASAAASTPRPTSSAPGGS